jgi:predicted transcriptional regulator
MATRKSANRRARTPVVSLRLRAEVVARADDIASALASTASHHRAARASGDVDRSYVLRWAIERGLDEIARELAEATSQRHPEREAGIDAAGARPPQRASDEPPSKPRRRGSPPPE